jgi:hypothetical protein
MTENGVACAFCPSVFAGFTRFVHQLLFILFYLCSPACLFRAGRPLKPKFDLYKIIRTNWSWQSLLERWIRSCRSATSPAPFRKPKKWLGAMSKRSPAARFDLLNLNSVIYCHLPDRKICRKLALVKSAWILDPKRRYTDSTGSAFKQPRKRQAEPRFAAERR